MCHHIGILWELCICVCNHSHESLPNESQFWFLFELEFIINSHTRIINAQLIHAICAMYLLISCAIDALLYAWVILVQAIFISNRSLLEEQINKCTKIKTGIGQLSFWLILYVNMRIAKQKMNFNFLDDYKEYSW